MDDFNDYTDEPSEDRYGPLEPSDFEGLDNYASLSGDDMPLSSHEDYEDVPFSPAVSDNYPTIDDGDTWDFYDSEPAPEAPGDHFFAADNFAGDDQTWEPPPNLDIETPQPVDGFPWTDVNTIADVEPTAFNADTELGTANPADLYHDSFEDAKNDSDPSIAALARWWGA